MPTEPPAPPTEPPAPPTEPPAPPTEPPAPADWPAPAESAQVLDAIRRAAAVNTLFALATGPANPEDVPGRPAAISASGWRPATSLADAATVRHLIAEVGSGLGDPPARISASMVVLGYSARLVAPAVAALLIDRLLLDVSPDRMCWRYAPGSGFQLRSPTPAGWRGTGELGACSPPPKPGSGCARPALGQRLLDQWSGQVIDGHLAALVASVYAVVPVARGLLWGNVASSLAGALRFLARAAAVSTADCLRAGSRLLAYGPLRGAGHLDVQGGQLSFLRRSCCLYYQLPGGGTCGDCPLPVSRPPRSR